MVNTLKEILTKERVFIQKIADNDGELTPEMEAELEINEDMRSQKVDSYYHLIDRVEAEIERIAKYEKTVSQSKKSLKGTLSWLKSNMKSGMLMTDKAAIEGNMHQFKLSKSKAKVVILDADKIPGTYLIENISYDIDKDKIYKDLMNGIGIAGVKLEQTHALRRSIRTNI